MFFENISVKDKKSIMQLVQHGEYITIIFEEGIRLYVLLERIEGFSNTLVARRRSETELIWKFECDLVGLEPRSITYAALRDDVDNVLRQLGNLLN